MPKKNNKNKKEKIFLIFFFFFLSVLILISQIKCPIRLIFHIYCPGCGITRMFISLIKLDFYQAFRYNPLVFIIIPIIIINNFFVKNLKIKKIIWYILIILCIVFGILRNINYFKFLAPTKIN